MAPNRPSPLAPNRPSPQDEPTEELEASSEPESEEETPKTKKPRSKASATTRPAARAESKRPSESDPKDSKRPKKKKISNSDPKKLFGKISIDDGEMTILFESICSDDDDRTILEGMIDYGTKKGVNPYHHMVEFHDFMKKSLKSDVDKTQLQHKMRMLKKKAKGKKYKLLEGCLEFIGEPKRTELKEEWKKLNVAELELVVRRGELAKLILEASK
ncbi:hypothetical protein Pyn_39769 [Prunus yedoensis var. nudiflora]|uniref:Glabrous enhancer-binding protein-like DBD domain-containing protein n=1 Tax=Prunus yedoensis var. nudiflora TaxID=2094558 RepID=A0A314XEY3_PRUYE|nr:hypothetical protein Pyn_39769 [Prunus yedoensis var. nudiflora]